MESSAKILGTLRSSSILKMCAV